MEAKRSAFLTVLLLCLILAGCGGRGEPPADPVHWNFLVYLDGDNNLEGALLDDLLEMKAATASEYIHIYVLFDRIAGHDSSEGDWTDTRLYHVANNTLIQLTEADGWYEAGTELDMSDPLTLQQFVAYCQSRPAADGQPAERTVLTISNHGGGVFPRAMRRTPLQAEPAPFRKDPSLASEPSRGICWDDTSEPDYDPDWNCLTTDEVAGALSAARAGGRKIDIIQTDACILQMLEIAYEWRNEADYLVGSEADVPWNGNNYLALLSALAGNPGMTAGQFARKMVDVFHAYYDGTGADTTFSVLSLGAELSALISAFDTFAAELNGTADLPAVYSAYTYTAFFSGIGRENRDLHDFAAKLIARSSDIGVRIAAHNLCTALNGAVLYHKNTGAYAGRAFGLSILLPNRYEWPYYDNDGHNQYTLLQLAADTDWNEFIARFVAYTASL